MFKTLISATKAMVSVVAIVLAFTLNASAQEQSTADAAKKTTDIMKTELSLTDVQYKKVLDINTVFTDKVAEARKSSTDKKQTAQVVKGLKEEKENTLKTVLTDDQYKLYLAKKEEKKQAFMKRVSEKAAVQKVSNTDLKEGTAKSVEKQ